MTLYPSAQLIATVSHGSAAESVPADFDPHSNPILARHYFGVDVIADLRRQRHVQRLHRLGPRAIDALLVEIGTERSIMTAIERKVEAYAELEPEALEAAGGDRFPPAPIYEVGR